MNWRTPDGAILGALLFFTLDRNCVTMQDI
jgi:hypothetical protein